MTKIVYLKGDVTQAPQEMIAHGCNALGVMGSGVAYAIRKNFPEAYSEYVAAHKDLPLQVGEVIYVESNNRIIANMITQQNVATYPGEVVVSYEGIRAALEDLNDKAVTLGIKEVAMPKIGAGLGGGDWSIIEQIIEETSEDYTPYVYEFP